MKAESEAEENTETYGETGGLQGDPFAGYGLPPGGNPLLEGYFEKSFMGRSITDEVIEDQIKMQYGFSITE